MANEYIYENPLMPPDPLGGSALPGGPIPWDQSTIDQHARKDTPKSLAFRKRLRERYTPQPRERTAPTPPPRTAPTPPGGGRPGLHPSVGGPAQQAREYDFAPARRLAKERFEAEGDVYREPRPAQQQQQYLPFPSQPPQRIKPIRPPEAGVGEGHPGLNNMRRRQEQFDREYEEEQRRKFGGDVTPGPNANDYYEMEAMDQGLLPPKNFSPAPAPPQQGLDLPYNWDAMREEEKNRWFESFGPPVVPVPMNK